MSVSPTEFQLQLVMGTQCAVAREIPYHERVLPRPYDEPGGWVVASYSKDCRLRPGQHILFRRTRLCQPLGLR